MKYLYFYLYVYKMSQIVCRNISSLVSNSLNINRSVTNHPYHIFLVNGYTVEEFIMENFELTSDIIKNMDSLMRLKGCQQVMYLDAACIKNNKVLLYMKPEMDLTLSDFISKVDYKRRSESTYKVFKELLEGVILMNKLNIRHGNINPDNVLIKFNENFSIDKVCYVNFQNIKNDDCNDDIRLINTNTKDIFAILNLMNTYITSNDYIEYENIKNRHLYVKEDLAYLSLISNYLTKYSNINADNVLYDINSIRSDFNSSLFPWGDYVKINLYDDILLNNNNIIINLNVNKYISRDVWTAIVKINEVMRFNIITSLINIEILSRYYSIHDVKSKYDILATSRLSSLYIEKKYVNYMDYYKLLDIKYNDIDIIELKNTEIKIYTEINYIIYNSFIIKSICKFYNNIKNLDYKSRYETLLNSYDTLFV